MVVSYSSHPEILLVENVIMSVFLTWCLSGCAKQGEILILPHGTGRAANRSMCDTGGQEVFYHGINQFSVKNKKRHTTKCIIKNHCQRFHPAAPLQTDIYIRSVFLQLCYFWTFLFPFSFSLSFVIVVVFFNLDLLLL